jgi:sugar O-acyltransferase (sialic acid O-acetyltransferase NeuD family)
VLDNREVVLIGYSCHGFVVADAAIEALINLKYYSDKVESQINPFHLTYVGFEKDIHFNAFGKGYEFILGVGDNKIRHDISENIKNRKETLRSVIHPDTTISNTVVIGNGSFVSRGVCVNAFAIIGENVILNTGCIIEHGCKISNSVHIAPGAVLAGDVVIGEMSFIGANSVIKQGIKIGENVIVGAGSVVVKDITNAGIYIGNPAKRMYGK